MNLLLIRHAHATWEEREWPDDEQRPLTDLGRQQAAAVGEALGRAVPSVDHLLSTSLIRAKQTAELIAEVTSWPGLQIHEPDFTGDLDPGWARVLLESFRRFEGSTVAYVGHEPTLSWMVTLLLMGDCARPIVEMGRCSAALIRFPDKVAPGEGSLAWLLSPRLL